MNNDSVPEHCADLHLTDNICEYIETHCPPSAFLDYLWFYYCSSLSSSSATLWIIWSLFILWLVLLFYELGVVSSQYFCPALSLVANFLKMTPDIAGLTLLALGNGSTDISSTFVAVVTNNFGIAVGELFGAGIFVTTVVVAVVSLVGDPSFLKYSFLRDVLFYFGGVLGASLLINDGYITLWKALLLLGYYLLYVATALLMNYSRCFRGMTQSQFNDVDTVENITPDEIELFVMKNNNKNNELEYENDVNNSINDIVEHPPKMTIQENQKKKSFFSWKKWKEEWNEKNIIQKIVYLLINVVTLPLILTVPESKRWNRIIAIFVPIFSSWPIMAVFGWLTKTTTIGSLEVPIWIFIEIGCIILSCCIYFTTNPTHPPIYAPLFTLWAFLMSILWIYIFAHELISFLTALGKILRVSTVILGATVLAWGNSVPDLVADVLLARKGESHMALTGVYATPAFNLLFGMGMSFTYMCIRLYPESYRVHQLDRPLFFLSGTFLLGGLLLSLFVITLQKFKISRKFAIILFILYCSFVVLAVLTEFKIVFQ